MKVYLLVLSLSFIGSLRAGEQHPHFPLELTQQDYQNLWTQHLVKTQKGINEMEAMASETRQAIDAGEKLSQWINKINEGLPEDQKIRLTSKKTRRGIPVDKPSQYGPSTIKRDHLKFKNSTPSEMSDVLYGKSPITDTLPMDRKLFIEHGRKINKLYQTAVRWTTVIEPYMNYFKSNKKRDIRGFYHLKAVQDLDQKLENFEQLGAKERREFQEHLEGICINTGKKTCATELQSSINNKKVLDFKEKYWDKAQEVWNSFFLIDDPRRDVRWTTANLMRIPFKTPEDTKIGKWLKENVEDEFKFKSWRLKLNYVGSGLGLSYLKFQPGVTPHVSQGNVIVMDANTDIEEYEVRWTIRHEYGHILRLPDCYVEFYDSAKNLAINYQIDITDLMCSRAGNMNERIYQELKRVYYRK